MAEYWQATSSDEVHITGGKPVRADSAFVGLGGLVKYQDSIPANGHPSQY